MGKSASLLTTLHRFGVVVGDPIFSATEIVSQARWFEHQWFEPRREPKKSAHWIFNANFRPYICVRAAAHIRGAETTGAEPSRRSAVDRVRSENHSQVSDPAGKHTGLRTTTDKALHTREPQRGYERLAFEATERARARSLLDHLTEAGVDIGGGVSGGTSNLLKSSHSTL